MLTNASGTTMAHPSNQAPSHRRNVFGINDGLHYDGDGPHGGGEPPRGGMEQRVTRLEQAVLRIDGNVDAIRASQIRIEERMERVMDRARDMPSPTVVDAMITSKLGLSALIAACLGVLIAAITYATTS